MANPFYTYSGSIIAGTLGRAETVATEFQSVQAGFADLATTGTDSGASGAAYVITTQGAPTGVAYSDGQQISFKAANTNAGAATLNANGIGAVSVLRFNGTPLQAGDITANSWYTLTYNATYNAWTLIGATVITFSGSISSASPVNKVGLVAAPGVSTAAAPIDAIYAIDTTIAPTWTGMHTWNAANNNYAIAVNGGSGAGQSFGMVINAGSSSADMALDVNSKAGINLITVYGDGGVVVGTPTGGDRGAGTINVSGGIFVNGVALPTVNGTNTFSGPNVFNGPLTVTGTASFSGPTTASGTLYANAINNISGAMTITGGSGITLAAQVTVTSTATFNNAVTVAGALTVNGFSTFAPTGTGVAMQVTPISGQYGMQVNGVGASGIAGISLVCTGGTFGTSDFFILQDNNSTLDGILGMRSTSQLRFRTNALDRLVIGTGGAVTISAPTSGVGLTVSGAVTINAAATGVGLSVNGASGTHSTQIDDSAGNAFNAGFLEIPQVSHSSSYTCVLSDSGKRMYPTTSGVNFTIPANASVPYPIGTVIGFLNLNEASCTISINSDTMYWLPSGSTGSRTIAQFGEAYAEKVAATTWVIKGVGVT